MRLNVLSQWGRDSSIETILVGIRRYVPILFYLDFSYQGSVIILLMPCLHREMATANNRKLLQPPEGTTF